AFRFIAFPSWGLGTRIMLGAWKREPLNLRLKCVLNINETQNGYIDEEKLRYFCFICFSLCPL
ncbi:MAG: hypothetical protein U9P79_10410, partial [Candidatus Cloacimonadota bacterium]|nr:hypothetical protein [Candidatus Cloacimonadota bacterium]